MFYDCLIWVEVDMFCIKKIVLFLNNSLTKGAFIMKNIFSFLLAALMGIFSFTQGQVSPDSAQLAALSNLQERMNNSLGINWNDKTGTPDIIVFSIPHSFDVESKNSANLFLKEMKNLLKKKEVEDDLRLRRINQVDSIQYIRFEQFYKNIPVSEGEYVITVLPGGKVQCALGKFHKNISIDVKPALNENEAFTSAAQNPPKNFALRDSLLFSQLIIYPEEGKYFLAWELKIPTNQEGEDWVYIIDASNGTVLSSHSLTINEISQMLIPQSQANVYLHHPYIDPSYSYISPINDNQSGYLQGTYANILNDATSRAYSSTLNFAYAPSNTHFDEANLFYHIDRFRRNLWNGLGFNAFTQITAHAHTYFAGGPNASYNPSDHHLRFSDGQGVYGYNSFAKEDKVIYHEYAHAVTDYVAQLSYGYSESGAIHEGNSDYFAGTFTGRSLQGEYISPVYTINQRDMTNPRIQNYTQYNDQNLSYWQQYGYHEPHFGGELWSAALWDLRQSGSVGLYYANRTIYYGLNAIPTNSSFLQYRQAIINADITYYNGNHANAIRHLFYLRGIGPDNLSVSIDGPSYLQFKQKGTYTADINGGSGNVSYIWYKNFSGQWQQISTNPSITLTMVYDDIQIKLDIHDNVTGENASATKTIHYGYPPPKIVADDEGKILPSEFSIEQNYPNPFNPSTQINYSLLAPAKVNIKVYDLLGREVSELVNEQKEAGFYTVNFNASNLSSGIYLYRITAQEGEKMLYSESKRMILLK